MSEVKVNKITPTTNCGTVTLGDSGDTIAIPAGVNLTSGGALTNSGTITNTGTITGVTITGTIDNQVNWQTDSIKTTGFTAVAGEGYFCNTTSAAFTVTLPATPTAGDLVGIKDYANTADTNNITIGRNGSNIEGVANDFVIEVEGGSITLIYVDATKGWLSTAAAKASDISEQALFVTATGGTITTCGDYKIHTFTSDSTFTVCSVGNPAGSTTVDYLVVAGAGAGGGGDRGGGGGAGGYRYASCFPVTVTSYPITVGAGAAASPPNGPPFLTPCSPSPANGSSSIFSTITSTGGGRGGVGGFSASGPICGHGGGDGGSGGGGGSGCGQAGPAGSGNTPPPSPSQGNNGGIGNPGNNSGAGGGGAGAVGTNAGPQNGGAGGIGSNASPIDSTYRAGGGGGNSPGYTNGTGGCGGGGSGNNTAGTVNTGGGGGGSGSGGSGIIMIKYKFQN